MPQVGGFSTGQPQRAVAAVVNIDGELLLCRQLRLW